ncbi:hypothetical protein MLM_3249B [Mycobacterium lepraemurium]|nr:hypothetical protein MLM_3249B [Mycobacterium lepraemurium]
MVAAALRGFLPAQHDATRSEAGGRAALGLVVAILAVTLALIAVSIVARLKDPRAPAPPAGALSEALGAGRGRPTWRVLLIGLGVIVAWLLIVMLLARLFASHGLAPAPPPGIGASPPPHPAALPAPPPQHPQRPRDGSQDTLGILLASTVAMLLMVVAAAVAGARRRWRSWAPAVPDKPAENPAPQPYSESLARAAERGLAEMADLRRDPREAIIACYAAMERELAHVPGALPQDFDTPSEVLARAVEHHALHADNAVQLVNLFTEARFSPHVMNDDLGDSLRRWFAAAETTIRWSESTRADWDRHLRPMLARRYAIATGQRQAKDPAFFQATGQMLFGAELWEWVNPNNVTRTGGPSPARDARRWKRFCESWTRYDRGRDPTMTLPAATTTAHCEAILDEIERVVVGKRSALRLILTAVLARGHILIEDLPGLGKTLIARSFAAALGLQFTRVQFTPDLLPTDLLGSTIYDMQSGRFAFRAGPIFTNLLLADEINRTPPKTQAALLKAMAEGQVSIDGETHRLPKPFIALATDKPIEYEGTYPLPEAQLDRFAIRLELRYLSERDETSMLRRRLERGSPEPGSTRSSTRTTCWRCANRSSR